MPHTKTRVAEIDWNLWQARDQATLVFVRRGDDVLLIHKKRGLGRGKINGPGGRLEPGEKPREAAIREVQEELSITPDAPEPRGELSFQFQDGYSMHVFVFVSFRFSGEARESEEAVPLWTRTCEIPYTKMWADDALWLPLLLDDQTFRGRFIFDGDAMLDHHLESGVRLNQARFGC